MSFSKNIHRTQILKRSVSVTATFMVTKFQNSTFYVGDIKMIPSNLGQEG